MVDINTNISIITLNVPGLNTPTKRWRLSQQTIKAQYQQSARG